MAIKLGVLQEQAIAVLYWMRHEVRSEVEKNTGSDADAS